MIQIMNVIVSVENKDHIHVVCNSCTHCKLPGEQDNHILSCACATSPALVQELMCQTRTQTPPAFIIMALIRLCDYPSGAAHSNHCMPF